MSRYVPLLVWLAVCLTFLNKEMGLEAISVACLARTAAAPAALVPLCNHASVLFRSFSHYFVFLKAQTLVSAITPGKKTMAPGAEPLSIESLLQKQKEEREAAARVRSFPHGAPIVIS